MSVGAAGGRIAVRAPAGYPDPAMIDTSLTVTGMTCGHCVKHVTEALRGVPGVTAVDVSLAEHRARVTFDPATATVDALVGAIRDAGYDAGAHPAAE